MDNLSNRTAIQRPESPAQDGNVGQMLYVMLTLPFPLIWSFLLCILTDGYLINLCFFRLSIKLYYERWTMSNNIGVSYSQDSNEFALHFAPACTRAWATLFDDRSLYLNESNWCVQSVQRLRHDGYVRLHRSLANYVWYLYLWLIWCMPWFIRMSVFILLHKHYLLDYRNRWPNRKALWGAACAASWQI